MRHYLPLLSLAALNLATACKKDTPTAPTVMQLLSAKKWQLRSASLSAPNTPTIDTYAISSPCVLDDVIQYVTPNVWSYDEGLTKCDPSDPQTRFGSWVLSSNDTQLTITFEKNTYTYTIDELTSTSLKLTNVRMQSGLLTTFKTTYVPIP